MKRIGALLLALLGGCDGNLTDSFFLVATTERVSLDSAGAEVFGTSLNPVLSGDGRFVAFQSNSSTLVAGDANGTADIFVRDTVLGTTTRVSVEAPATAGFPDGPDGAADGTNATGSSVQPDISADGRFVAFQSDATDLITDTPKPAGQTDIYVRDLLNNTTTLVSHDTGGGFANGASSAASISPDGRFVAFVSIATDLTADAVSGTTQHVFIWDRNSGLVELVSKHTGGAVGNANSVTPCVSETGSNGVNGVFVVFMSPSGNLETGAGAATPESHVFRKAIPAGAAVMVDVAAAPSDNTSQQPYISPDGRFVVFRSAGTNLAAVDINGQDDIFLRDMTVAPGGFLTLVSRQPSGAQAGGASSNPSVSSDGRYVAFFSAAPNLVAGDTNGTGDMFWRDLQSTAAASLQRVNVATFGQQSLSQALNVSSKRGITADGRFVAYSSGGADLVNGDTNGSQDIFVRGPLH